MHDFVYASRRRIAWLLALVAAMTTAAGCRSRSNRDFVPPEALAQELLNVALTSWRDRNALGVIQEAGPRIELYDSHHKAGQSLAAFDILGPTTGDADRCFAVKLSFVNPAEEIRARFVVFGADPYTVIRYEDYEMLSHWDHHSPDTDGKRKP